MTARSETALTSCRPGAGWRSRSGRRTRSVALREVDVHIGERRSGGVEVDVVLAMDDARQDVRTQENEVVTSDAGLLELALGGACRCLTGRQFGRPLGAASAEAVVHAGRRLAEPPSVPSPVGHQERVARVPPVRSPTQQQEESEQEDRHPQHVCQSTPPEACCHVLQVLALTRPLLHSERRLFTMRPDHYDSFAESFAHEDYFATRPTPRVTPSTGRPLPAMTDAFTEAASASRSSASRRSHLRRRASCCRAT
jgi:hypothetical protein